ncbi:MAG: asparagine synthase C-terminal domain-containing protein [Thermoplasmata archaeon]
MTDDSWRALDEAFSAAITPWTTGGSPIAVLFSGGVDSGLLAWELRDRPGLVLSTIGSRDSADLRIAAEGAAVIRAQWIPTVVDASEVRTAAERLHHHLDDLTRTTRGVLIAFSLAVEHAPPGAILCGQGVDELFLGYAHFRATDAERAAERARADLRQLLDRDWPRAQRIARELGREIYAPYLDPRFIAAALHISNESRRPLPVPKAFFRRWAMQRGLPASIADRPKRALQFGSGIDRLIPREKSVRSKPD